LEKNTGFQKKEKKPSFLYERERKGSRKGVIIEFLWEHLQYRETKKQALLTYMRPLVKGKGSGGTAAVEDQNSGPKGEKKNEPDYHPREHPLSKETKTTNSSQENQLRNAKKQKT